MRLTTLALVTTNLKCYCPDDCWCHKQWKGYPNICGCKAHDKKKDK
jgi:hypothetical protein